MNLQYTYAICRFSTRKTDDNSSRIDNAMMTSPVRVNKTQPCNINTGSTIAVHPSKIKRHKTRTFS